MVSSRRAPAAYAFRAWLTACAFAIPFGCDDEDGASAASSPHALAFVHASTGSAFAPVVGSAALGALEEWISSSGASGGRRN